VQVFAIRVVDRVGKGIRSAPRDALLAASASPTTRGKIFGFHRSMDHAGAVVGPLMATLFLYFYPGSYRTLFALTIVPGLVAMGLILLVHESADAPPIGSRVSNEGVVSGSSTATTDVVSAFSRTDAVSDSPQRKRFDRSPDRAAMPGELRAFFVVLTLFTLGNSTDAFLLLKLTDVAGSAAYIPLIWAALHVVKATVSIVGGSWSDRIGRRTVIGLGWLIYAAVYIGFAMTSSLEWLLVWFMVYGLYFGFAEGTEKALVADLAPVASRGFAFGIYNAVLGIGALLASVVFGLLWSAFGSAVAFGTGAALAVLATVLLFAVVRR
jgi:MFS family permease